VPNSKSVWIFLVLVFLLSWPFLVYGFGWFAASGDILQRYLLSCTGMLMVAFAAFATRTFVERRGFRNVGWDLGRCKDYIAILLFCALLWLLPPLAAWPFGSLKWNYSLPRDELLVVVLSLGGFSVLAGFGEEFGWRGYLLPRLLHDRQMARLVVVAVGFVWGIWHCAVAIGPLVKASLEGAAGWPMFGQALVSCAQMIGTSIALSFIFGAVWLKSKSIFLVSFLHGYWIGLRDAVAHLFSYPPAFRLVTLAVILAAWFLANRWLAQYERRTEDCSEPGRAGGQGG